MSAWFCTLGLEHPLTHRRVNVFRTIWRSLRRISSTVITKTVSNLLDQSSTPLNLLSRKVWIEKQHLFLVFYFWELSFEVAVNRCRIFLEKPSYINSIKRFWQFAFLHQMSRGLCFHLGNLNFGSLDWRVSCASVEAKYVSLRSDCAVHFMRGARTLVNMLTVGYKFSAWALSARPIFDFIAIICILSFRFFT